MAKIYRFRTLPWMLTLQAALIAGEHWARMPEHERARLIALLREARGWPGNLTAHERQELRRLVIRLDFVGMGRDMLPLWKRGAKKLR